MRRMPQQSRFRSAGFVEAQAWCLFHNHGLGALEARPPDVIRVASRWKALAGFESGRHGEPDCIPSEIGESSLYLLINNFS